jgi:hypothetical protein
MERIVELELFAPWVVSADSAGVVLGLPVSDSAVHAYDGGIAAGNGDLGCSLPTGRRECGRSEQVIHGDDKESSVNGRSWR